MKNLKNKKGFTLIELIVVIAILGILALFLVPQFQGYSKDAKEQVAKANTRTVWTAANAALTQSEYDKTIVVKDDGTGANGIIEIAYEKLGSGFTKNDIKMEIDVTKKDVTKVGYTTNGITCEYSGGETFTCGDATK